jgi:hypothetical protein
LLIGVLLALVKYDCQVVVGDSGVMLLRPWIQTNINFRGCHNRAAMKNSDLKDLEILVTTQDFQPLIQDGPLHSVTVVHARLIKPAELYAINGEFPLAEWSDHIILFKPAPPAVIVAAVARLLEHSRPEESA